MKYDLPRGHVIEIRLRAWVTLDESQKIKKGFDLSGVEFVEDEEDIPPERAL
jgi:hypothetical protein